MEKRKIEITDELLAVACRLMFDYRREQLLKCEITPADLSTVELATLYQHETENCRGDIVEGVIYELLLRQPDQEPTPQLWELVYRICPAINPAPKEHVFSPEYEQKKAALIEAYRSGTLSAHENT